MQFAALQRAKHLWQENPEAVGEAIVRAQEIVAKLLSGLTPDRHPPLVNKVAAVYTYIFRALAIAHLQRHEKSLDDAIRVLEIERDTWRQVCQQLGSEPGNTSPASPHFGISTSLDDQENSSRVSFEV